jgi:hypothetical protein
MITLDVRQHAAVAGAYDPEIHSHSRSPGDSRRCASLARSAAVVAA